mmetsp:Transcript_59960/g.131639  ORF Transcript_59960/g.131639 Transcript_59960/m.131639 type:complete len:697 (+) Transcript_59960:112-2202(+)
MGKRKKDMFLALYSLPIWEVPRMEDGRKIGALRKGTLHQLLDYDATRVWCQLVLGPSHRSPCGPVLGWVMVWHEAVGRLWRSEEEEEKKEEAVAASNQELRSHGSSLGSCVGPRTAEVFRALYFLPIWEVPRMEEGRKIGVLSKGSLAKLFEHDETRSWRRILVEPAAHGQCVPLHGWVMICHEVVGKLVVAVAEESKEDTHAVLAAVETTSASVAEVNSFHGPRTGTGDVAVNLGPLTSGQVGCSDDVNDSQSAAMKSAAPDEHASRAEAQVVLAASVDGVSAIEVEDTSSEPFTSTRDVAASVGPLIAPRTDGIDNLKDSQSTTVPLSMAMELARSAAEAVTTGSTTEAESSSPSNSLSGNTDVVDDGKRSQSAANQSPLAMEQGSPVELSDSSPSAGLSKTAVDASAMQAQSVRPRAPHGTPRSPEHFFVGTPEREIPEMFFVGTPSPHLQVLVSGSNSSPDSVGAGPPPRGLWRGKDEERCYATSGREQDSLAQSQEGECEEAERSSDSSQAPLASRGLGAAVLREVNEAAEAAERLRAAMEKARKVCRSCGAKCTPPFLFCPDCGTAQAHPGPPDLQPAIEEEDAREGSRQAAAAPATPPRAKTASWMLDATWVVVGGANKGGVLVREGVELDSKAAPMRLAVNARVMERDLRGNRLRFTKLEGEGPDQGWVTVSIESGGGVKELLRREEE